MLTLNSTQLFIMVIIPMKDCNITNEQCEIHHMRILIIILCANLVSGQRCNYSVDGEMPYCCLKIRLK